uniref:Uncharacterized protein n=1 Tax=Cannabis sativa TaxID=3483 RepID=A0A803Q979_CANSA
MVFCSISLFEELYLRPHNHQILNPNDGTLPYPHLAYMEHSSIFFTFFIYAMFAIILDCLKSPVRYELTLFLTALTYAQSFGGLHFHTADHMGPEGQYHLLLQVLLLVALATALLGIGFRKSFLISFVRSLVVVFVGIWDIFMGVMLWTPSLLAKDCFLSVDEITGGTPSLVPPRLVSSVLEILRLQFGLSSDVEMSMEMDPGTFDALKLKQLMELGINRVSLGVQAFQDELLKSPPSPLCK